MFNLETIMKMWKEDCVIDNANLDVSSQQTPMLHAKYLEMLSLAKLQLKRSEHAQKSLLKDKFLYYNGKMDQEQIEALGWEFDPFNGLKVLKGEMEYYYDADSDIQKTIEKITYWKTIISTLEEIVGNIKWRSTTISNIIKWKMFEAGV
jgi:hypothetical protein